MSGKTPQHPASPEIHRKALNTPMNRLGCSRIKHDSIAPVKVARAAARPRAAVHKSPPLPSVLPIRACAACGFEHPKPKGEQPDGASPFLNPSELAGFLGKRVSSIYSEKSRGQLPAPIGAGRSNPRWDPCVIASWLHGQSKNARSLEAHEVRK